MRKLKLQELRRVDVDTFRAMPKHRITLVLDDIRSALNVGSAFRTADGFALEKVILCGITAQPPHREIMKTAIGATDSMDWEYRSSCVEAVQSLQEAGYRVYAVEQAEGSVPLQDFRPPEGPLALVFGNEVEGVQQTVMDVVDGAIEVPQFGTKHSFNVSVCIGMVLWEVMRGRLAR